MTPSKAGIARVVIFLSWLGMMGWFIRYEAYPEVFTNTLEGYRDVLSEGQLFMDSWMKIMFKGSPIGISHTTVEVADNDPFAHYTLGNRTWLNLNIMGDPQQINVLSGGALDIMYKLQKFNFSLSSKRYSMRIDGERRDGDTFVVHVKSEQGMQVARLQIPGDVILYSPLMEMSMSKLKPGEHLRVKTLDPASMTVGNVMIKALRNEKIVLAGQSLDSMVLGVEYQGVELLTWIDADGKILRQETPLGWTMETCTAEEAMSLKLDSSRSEDMLRETAVPCGGVIDQPAALRELKLRLYGAPLEDLVLDSARQRVLSNTNAVAVIVAAPAAWPAAGNTVEEPKLAPYRMSTPFVQSDDPAVVRQARKIVGNKTNDVDKARAIYEWVYKNMRKEAAVSLPSTVDVLSRMEGDCNEHTYLFVGLARAAGLPSKIRVGLLYKDGVFYYHAWPSVYVGGWVEMDPTIGQELADASHIGLLEGEIGNQLKLFGLLGRLRAAVLEQKY